MSLAYDVAVNLDLTALQDRFQGEILTPTDPGYESARVLFNTRIRTQPAVICRCLSTDDAVEAVRFARETDLPIAVRGGGHHACGFSLVDRGLVIDLSMLKGVTFDPATAMATVGAGSGWRDVDRATYVDVTVPGEDGLPSGYAVPGGDCPTVSNAGYSLSGGYGLLGRRFGLACDHIIEAEVVDAEGRVLHVSELEHPDLFWALRGAGEQASAWSPGCDTALTPCRRLWWVVWRCGRWSTPSRFSAPIAIRTSAATRTACRSIWC